MELTEEPKYKHNNEEKNDNFENQHTIDKNLKKNKKKIDTNVILIIFGLVVGIVISGSFGIDFFGKNKNFESPEGETEIFEKNGKTWRAFDDPIVNVTIISDKECQECSHGEVVDMIRGNIPTIKTRVINFDTEEAQKIIDIFEIKSIPAFVFDSKITKIKDWEDQTEIREVFIEKDDIYLLDSAKIGIPVGRHIGFLEVNENDIFKGPKDAKVTIIEFSDFECPFCKKGKENIDEVLKIYGDEVKLVFKHFPLPSHSNAQKAAEASECANEQGKFWEMHDAMFEDQSKLAVSDLKQTAQKIGLVTKEFNNCLDSGKYEGKVKSDMGIGSEYGVGGTPAFFIGEDFLSGAQSPEKFQIIIDKQLER
ncbi:MAG: thioredoxin domain-containing protein [Patescibacteria group bacterium]|nr:thioredoxin domain-containing protein [Patescibacteria group bacterium]